VELEATSEAAAAQGRQAELEDKAAEAAVTEEEEEEEEEEVTLEESARRDRDGDDPCDTGGKKCRRRRALRRRENSRRREDCRRCESLQIAAKFEDAREVGRCGWSGRNQVCPSGQYCNYDGKCGSSEQDMKDSCTDATHHSFHWSNNADCYCSEDGGYCNQSWIEECSPFYWKECKDDEGCFNRGWECLALSKGKRCVPKGR